MIKRCIWPMDDPLMLEYHDSEWGVPVHDDRLWFEHIVLDGAQAGLSWRTILHKRENYRKAFDDFQPEKVARYTEKRIAKLLKNRGIVRNRLKVHSAVRNAKAFLNIQQEFGCFDDYVWRFVDGQPIQNKWKSLNQMPATSKESDALSKDLKERDMNFVGSTICYAFMQAAGMVNDHTVTCFRYKQIQKIAKG